MGNLGETMKKIVWGLLLFLHLAEPLLADTDMDKVKRRVRIIGHTAMGWCTEEKALNLLDLVLEVQPKVCVEIGVFGGASLIPMACGLKFLGQGIVIGIDPWENSECIKRLDIIEEKEHVDWWSKVKLQDIYYTFLDRLLLYELEDYCRIMNTTSDRAAPEIAAIDILHIDGHRSEEQTMQDVRLYFPKVSSGGYIWMGDTLCFNKQKAVDFLLEQCDVVKVIDNGNCVLFRKR